MYVRIPLCKKSLFFWQTHTWYDESQPVVTMQFSGALCSPWGKSFYNPRGKLMHSECNGQQQMFRVHQCNVRMYWIVAQC